AAGQGQAVEVGDVEVPPRGEEQGDDAEHEAHVANASGDHCLDGGVGVDLLLPPVADQHERAHADQLPADQQLEGVVGHDQVEHGRREERQGGVEVREAAVAVHVADRIDVHHQRHGRDDDDHHHGQAVDVGPGVDMDATEVEPLHV